MSTYLNYAAMAATRLRSDGLGPTDSIAHPLAPGRHLGTVWLGDAPVGRFTIEVGEEGDGEQIDIDLARVGEKSACAAAHTFHAAPQRGSPVFAVFHNSAQRSGYRVELRHEGKRETVFNSAALGAGDYYILMPLQPGRWTLRTAQGAQGSLAVEPARPDEKPRPSQLGTMIRTDGTTFDPAEAKIMSGDGLVFEVTGANVAIEVAREAEKGKPTGPRPAGVRFVRARSVGPRPGDPGAQGGR